MEKSYLIKQSLFRGVIPFIVMLLIAAYLKSQDKAADAKSTFVASFIVLFVGVATLIYDYDAWSVSKKILVHFLAMLVTVYPTLLLSGWFKVESFTDALKVFGIFIATGAGILAVFGLGYLIKVRLFA